MTVTFSVNLLPDNYYSSKQPYNLTRDGPNFEYTRSIWLPNLFRDNHDLKQGNTFVSYDNRAQYLINTYTTGTNPLLTVVSNVAP